ncbi:Uncharacterised protein [Mycobacterium tuberculosis]|nr:Uncharacterised protein [Mycobacterium tuberculosis]
MPRGTDHIVPQNHPVNTGMRAEIDRRIRPRHLYLLPDVCADQPGKFLELWPDCDHRTCRRRTHHELGECLSVTQVEGDVDIVEGHVDRASVHRLADQYPS